MDEVSIMMAIITKVWSEHHSLLDPNSISAQLEFRISSHKGRFTNILSFQNL